MIVGIAGNKQSGKNTVAKIWQLLAFETSPLYNEVLGTKYTSDVAFVAACIRGEQIISPYIHAFKWKEKAFAFKLKLVVCALTGCTIEQLEKEEFKNSNLPYTWSRGETNITTYRELLQQLGTDIFRENIHDNIWVDLLMDEYDKAVLERDPKNWLITDVRFTNEADAIQRRGGVLIQVHRESQTVDNHRSENGLKDASNDFYNVYNDGTLEELIAQVKTIMKLEEFL